MNEPIKAQPMALRRWQGSVNEANTAGVATFQAGGQMVSVSMACFSDARAVAKLIEQAREQGRQTAHTALVQMLQGAMQSTRNT